MEKYFIRIYKSNTSLEAQLKDPSGKTLVGKKYTFAKEGVPVAQSEAFGADFAKLVSSKGVKKIVFDRGKNIYHGRVKAFADGLRSQKIEF